MIYNEPTTTPQRLTDEQAGYDEPSEAAMETVERFQVWLYAVDSVRVPEDEAIRDIARWFDRFAAQAVEAALNHAQYIHMMESDDKADKAVEAREAQFNALKAVANKMAVAVRSVRSDAVYDPCYEDGDGNEYPAYAVDSDYMNTLYQALREYEQVTDPAPKLQTPKCPSCKGTGYIWATETPDTGHDYQTNCPVCNPKIDLYAADRYESDF